MSRPAPAAPPAGGSRGLLLLLAVLNFAVGFGAFVAIGVLPPLAASLAVTPATAGQVMGVYAVAYGLASPIGVALTGGWGRRTVLMTGGGLFAAGAVACALAPDFPSLLAARVLMAVGGGLVTPIAAAVAIGLVAPQERGRALSLVFGGLTLAQALGVPAGAFAGYALGWRAAFVIAAMLALAATAMLLRLPARIAAPATSLRTLADTLRMPALVVAVSFTAVFIAGLYVLYTFLAAFMESRLGLQRDGVSLMLLVYGAGAVAGNWMGGRLTDRIGPARTLIALALAQVPLMTAITLAPLGPSPAGLVAAGALLFGWSVSGWAFMVPQQARLAALDGQRMPVLFSLNAAAIYLGAWAGSSLGGAVLKSAGTDWLGPAGGLVCLSAIVTLALADRLRDGPHRRPGAAH